MILLAIIDADSDIDDVGRLMDGLIARRAVTEPEMKRVREAAHKRGLIDRRFAAEVFHANRQIDKAPSGWAELYLELLTSFFLTVRGSDHVLSTDREKTLLAWLGEDVRIENLEERRLALRILLKISHPAERLERRVLNAVMDNLLHHSEHWLGYGDRSPGVIDRMDIQLLRRLVFNSDGQATRRASRGIPKFLLELQQNVRDIVDSDGWQRLWPECGARAPLDQMKPAPNDRKSL
jgi:hypothetical protein